MNIATLIFFAVLAFAYGQDRKIITALNPGCDTCTSETVVVYIRAVGTNDTLHQLWDFTGVPTVLYTVGPLNSTITIGWWDNHPTRFTYIEQPYYSFGLAIDKLYEYNDVNDTGKFDPSYKHKITLLSDLSWHLVNKTLTNKEASVNVHGKFNHRKDKTGFIDVKLDLIPFTAEGVELPHLIHTANSSLIDIRLVNLTMTRRYNCSRFALGLVLISTDDADDSWNCTTRKSLDDEHTPGVFELIEIKSPREMSKESGGFLQFYPVAYSDPQRTVSSSTNAYVSGFNRSVLPNSGAVKQFYQDYKPASLLLQDAAISFGTAGDGFYTQRNFTAWSLTFGYGEPPTERLSLLVCIIIIATCSILATLLMVAVGFIIYYLVRKCKQRNTHNYLLF